MNLRSESTVSLEWSEIEMVNAGTMAEGGRGGGGEPPKPKKVVRAPPPGIGEWSLLQILEEAGRLLHKQFGDFSFCILIFIVPASFITALHAELFPAHFVHPPHGSQGSTDPEESVWAVFSEEVLTTTAFLLPRIGIVVGASLMFSVLTKAIYSDCEVGHWPQENLFDSMKLAFVIKGKETENPVLRSTESESSLYERFRKTSKGKKLKALAVLVVCNLVYFILTRIATNFTPQDWPRTFFWFALAITLLLTWTTSYLILVHLVLFIWLCSPSSCAESSDLESGKRGSHEQDPLLKPKLTPA